MTTNQPPQVKSPNVHPTVPTEESEEERRRRRRRRRRRPALASSSSSCGRGTAASPPPDRSPPWSAPAGVSPHTCRTGRGLGPPPRGRASPTLRRSRRWARAGAPFPRSSPSRMLRCSRLSLGRVDAASRRHRTFGRPALDRSHLSLAERRSQPPAATGRGVAPAAVGYRAGIGGPGCTACPRTTAGSAQPTDVAASRSSQPIP